MVTEFRLPVYPSAATPGVTWVAGAGGLVGGQFWNWEDSPVQAGIPSNVYSNDGIVNPEVADDTLTIGTYSVASLGYTKTYNMDAQSVGTYNYFQLSSAISSGTIRMEVLVGVTAAAGSQADFFHYITDLAASAKNWIGNSISKNGGDPRHRGYNMSDESNVTCISTTSTGTWVSPADDTGWCLCQLEYDFSTRVLKSEFINLETGHTTGQETSAAQTALDAPLEFLRIGPRNISGNTPVYMAQIWVGTADDEWPAGKLNGFG